MMPMVMSNAALTFARIFSAPMAIPAWASPPIKGWLPALGKIYEEEGKSLFLEELCQVSGVPYLRSMIMSCMFGAGVILVPSRVSTFEWEGIVGQWPHHHFGLRRKISGLMIFRWEKKRNSQTFQSLKVKCVHCATIFWLPISLCCEHCVPPQTHQALLLSVNGESEVWTVAWKIFLFFHVATFYDNNDDDFCDDDYWCWWSWWS